ncbi:MAG TPA: RHS repeat-associated core domain-containing protein, partial [Streptosporangiaceae bacterium]|nr:RHS repeat-associated core domain-containing protein [Streptosporangiaceae bacterium]
DPIGDLVTIKHTTKTATWTRDFGFGGLQPDGWQTAWTSHLNTGSLWPSPPNTRLTHLSNDPTANAPTYSYDPNGNLTGITTSRHLDWTHDDRLGSYQDQAGTAEPTMTATYLYDSAGTRVKKAVTRGQFTESTTYIDGVYEYFTRISSTGVIKNNTLHIMIGADRVASIRVGTPLPGDSTPAMKYVLGDLIGTSAVVLDDTGTWVNREEYSPYGETLLGSYAHKRYRYAGRERDEESGLDYSQARYYAPWLARWISPDPITIQSLASDLNPYTYAGCRPVTASDPSGLDDQKSSPASAAAPDPKSPQLSLGSSEGSGGTDAKKSDDDDDLFPSQLQNRTQGGEDVDPNAAGHWEAQGARTGPVSAGTVYGRWALDPKDALTRRTIGPMVTYSYDESGKASSVTVTPVYHVSWEHTDKRGGILSAYLQPHLTVGSGQPRLEGGVTGTGALSGDLSEHVSADFNLSLSLDTVASAPTTSATPPSGLTISPAGYFGLGGDITYKFKLNEKPFINVTGEAGIGWQSGTQTAPSAPGGTSASNVQRYAGVSIATNKLGVPYAGLYLGVTEQTWRSGLPPLSVTPITPGPQFVGGIVVAF